MKGGRALIRRYKGGTQCWLPGFVTEEVLKQTTTFPVDESDIFAVSFPKSGKYSGLVLFNPSNKILFILGLCSSITLYTLFVRIE